MYVYIVDRLVSIKHMDLEVRTRLPFGSLYLCLFPKRGATCLSSLASGFFQNSPPSGASMIRQPSGICSRKETVLDSAEAWIGGQKSQQQILLQDTGSLGLFQKDDASNYRHFMLMDISRLPCKENPPTTPLYRTHRGDESHNESCLYHRN